MRVRAAITAVALLVFLAGQVGAQSLEEEMRRPPGTNSLDNDSMQLRGRTQDQEPTDNLDNDSMDLRGRTHDQEPTDSLDDDSMQLRGRTQDQEPTNSLDNGSLDGGNRPDPDWQ